MRKPFLITALAIVAVWVTAAFLPAPGTSGYKVGDKATTFKLKNIDGNMVSLDDFKDAKGFIVIFSCNHCPWVEKYESRMLGLHKTFAGKGYPVVLVNPNGAVVEGDNFENMQKRAKDKGYKFPYLEDLDQSVAKTYGAEKTPHVYVLEKKDGNLIVQYIGAIDDNAGNAKEVKEKYVENAVNALLAGREVPVKETKALGCSVKWQK